MIWQRVTILLFLLSSMMLPGVFLEADWRKNKLFEIVDNLKMDHPELDDFIWKLDASWVPRLWTHKTKENIVNRIILSANKRFRHQSEVLIQNTPSKENFEKILYQWNALDTACRVFEKFQNSQTDNICNSEVKSGLPQKWVKRFHINFGGNYFINTSHNEYVLSPTLKSKEKICNLQPLAHNIYRVNHVTSHNISNLQNKLLGGKNTPFVSTSKTILKAGECINFELTGLGIDPTAYIYTEFSNKDLGTWFYDVWTTYHVPWMKEKKIQKKLHNMQMKLFHEKGISFDLELSQLSSKKNITSHPKSCHNSKCFVRGKHFKNNIKLSLIYMPSVFLTHEGQLIDKQTGKLIPNLFRNILDQARIMSEKIEVQYVLEEKWNNRQLQFYLSYNDKCGPKGVKGCTIWDFNGPLQPGIYVSNLPQTTILSDEVVVPDGYLYRLDSCYEDGAECFQSMKREIHSVGDYYESLNNHGNSYNFGIHSPIRLGLSQKEHEKGYYYLTRHRFNLRSPQNFNTDVDPSTTCAEGGFDWLSRQRRAYARQIDQSKYENCELVRDVGLAIVGGGAASKGLRWLGRSLGLVRTATALVEGAGIIAFEAKLSGYQTLMTSPKLISKEDLEKRIQESEILGGVLGGLGTLAAFN